MLVGTVLERAGIEAVLCGGSAATFYAPEAYQSEDLDFVLEFGADGSSVRAALASLGYRFKNGLFVHDESHFTVEFPPGPLAIGDRPPIEVMTLHEGDKVLKIISPTDSVCDRLNKYAAWDDFSALRAAVGVARATQIDVGVAQAFLKREWSGAFASRYAEAWRIFERRLSEKP